MTAHLCLGIDPLPVARQFSHFEDCLNTHRRFLDRGLVPSHCFLKVNLSFFLSFGDRGLTYLTEFFNQYGASYNIILDGKFNEIGNSLGAQLDFAVHVLGARHVTLNPWFGWESVELAVDRLRERQVPRASPAVHSEGGTVFVLGATSEQSWPAQTMCHNAIPYLLPLIQKANTEDPSQVRVGLVVGANRRDVFDDLLGQNASVTLLSPGLGAQGASWDVVTLAKRYLGKVVFPVSRGIFSGGQASDAQILNAWQNYFERFA